MRAEEESMADDSDRNTVVTGVKTRGRGGSVVVGIVLVALGAIFLLERQGLVPSDLLFHLWPLILVIIGLTKLFGSYDRDEMKERIWGIILILFGSLLLIGEFGYPQLRFFRVWPFLLIVLGVYVVWSAIQERQPGSVSSDAQLDSVNIFGGGQYRIGAKNFRGGRILAIFGGFELDLSTADIEGAEAVIEVNALFGGGEIKIPPTWHLVVSGAGIFGGYGDETQPPVPNPAAPNAKTLILKGVAVFGGVSIKN
jgi:predicted membrane protein